MRVAASLFWGHFVNIMSRKCAKSSPILPSGVKMGAKTGKNEPFYKSLIINHLPVTLQGWPW